MVKTFTKKLLLEEDTSDKKTGKREIVFRSYLKEDYIEKSLKLTNENGLLKSAYFSSNDFGTSYWTNGRGVHDSHRWENDDDLQNLPNLSRHYPTLLQDGEVSPDIAMKKIIPDVLDSLLDKDLATVLAEIFSSDSYNQILDWDSLVERYRELNNAFLEELKKR